MKKIIMLLILLLVLIGCEDNKGLSAKVTIDDTGHMLHLDNIHNGIWVYYSIKNTGSETIRGWTTYFFINFSGGPTVTMTDKVTDSLEPGEKESGYKASITTTYKGSHSIRFDEIDLH